jgi:hypothetical protein
MLVPRQRAVIVLSLVAVWLFLPRLASAGVPQWPQRHTVVQSSKPSTESDAKPPKDHHAQLGRGFDGSDLFCTFAAVRYRLGSQHQRSPHRRESSVRSSGIELGDRPGMTRTAGVRAVDSLSAHLIATHLSI